MSNSPISPKSLVITSSPACDKHLVQSPVIDIKSNVGVVRALKNEVANLQCETSYLQSELDLTKNELFKCKNDAEAKSRRILRLENELFVSQNGKSDETCGRRRRRSAVGREKELREEVRLLESINTSLNKDLDTAHTNAHILTDKVSELEKEKIKLAKQNLELEDSIFFLKSQVTSNEKLISELQITCQDLRDVLDENCENSVLEKRSLNRSLLACDSAALEEPLTSVVEIKYAELESNFKILESDLSGAQAKICEKDREIISLKHDLETKMTEIACLVNDLENEQITSQKYDESKVQLEEMVQLLKDEIASLKHGMTKRGMELSMLECRNLDLQEEVNSLNNLMLESEIELIHAKNDLSSKSQNILKFEETIRIKEEQVEFYKMEKSSIAMSMETLSERLAEVSSDNQYIHAINEALVIDNNNQKLSISRLKSEKQDDDKKLAILTSLYDETNASLQHKISMIGQLEEKIALANQEKEAEIQRVKEAMAALECTLAEQINVKESFASKITDLENDVSELQKKNSELQQQILTMHEEDRQSCDIMKGMTDKLSEFEAKIKLKCQREKDLEKEISRLKNDIEEKNLETSEVSLNLKGEITEKENIIGTLNMELDMIKKLYNSEKECSELLKADSKSALSLLDTKSQELVNLREELLEARKSLASHSDLLENHKKACEVQKSLNHELEESKQSIDTLRGELNQARNLVEEHSTLHLKLTALQELHESTLQELQTRESDLKLELDSERAIFKDLQFKANQMETELLNSKQESQNLADQVNQDTLLISEKDEAIRTLTCSLEKLRESLQTSSKECDLTEVAEYVKSEISIISKDRDTTIQELLCTQRELESLKIDVAILKEENANLNNMLEQVQGNLDMEIAINSDLKKELEITVTSAKLMKTEIEKINNELAKKSSDLDALNQMLTQDDEIKKELKNKLNEAQFNIQEIDENYNKVIDNIKIEHSAQLGLKDVEIKKLNEELELVCGSLHGLREESSTVFESTKQFKQENSELEFHSKEVGTDMSKQELLMKGTSLKVSSSLGRLQTAQSELVMLEDTIHSLQGDIKQMSESEKLYKLNIKNLNEKLEVANQSIDKMHLENQSFRNNIELLNDKIGNLERTNKEVSDINYLLKTSVSDYEAKLADSSDKIKSLESQVSELHSNMLENNKFEEEVFLQLQLFDEDLSILKESNLALCKSKNNLLDVLSYSLQKCRDLHNTLMEKDVKISSLLDKIDGLVSQMSKIQNDLGSTVESNQLLQSTIDNINAQLNNASTITSEREVGLQETIKVLTDQVALKEEELSVVKTMLNHSNDLVKAKNIGISNLECEKYDCLKEISQLQHFVADLSEIICEENKSNNQDSVLVKNANSKNCHSNDELKVRNFKLLCYKNYRSLKRLLQIIHSVFGEESIIVRGDNLLVDVLSESEENSSPDLNGIQKTSELVLLQREQQIIESIRDQLEMIIVVLKEKNDRLSQVSWMRTDAEQNLRQAKDRAALLEDEIFKLQLEVDRRESYIQEIEKLRLHETGLLRSALETREASIEHLRERISYLEDSESRLTVELKVKVEELTKLSYDLGTKLKQAYFERDTVTASASDNESTLNKNIALLETLIKEKEQENTKLQQGIKMLEHEKSVLDRRVCFLTKDLEDLKKLTSSPNEEFAESSDLQLTDEQKLTLKPSLQKELPEDHRRSSGARSSLYSERKKEVGQISYHKPGPPTPSKNGRLSLTEVSPHLSDKPEPSTVEFDKENHGKIKSLFTAKSKSAQVPLKKKGFFRRKFGRENSSTNV